MISFLMDLANGADFTETKFLQEMSLVTVATCLKLLLALATDITKSRYWR